MTAQTLVERSSHGNLIVPGKAMVESEFKARALELGTVRLDLDSKENHFVLPEDAYLKLLHYELAEVFRRGRFNDGRTPAWTVNVAIERMQLVGGAFIIPRPSVVRIRMEVVRPDESIVMRGSVQCVEAEMVPIPGGAFAIPHGSETMAHAKLFPAVSSLAGSILSGLREGKALDAFEVLPDDVVQASNVLKHSPFGLAPLTQYETEEITGTRLPARAH
jgi:hypothetical protein